MQDWEPRALPSEARCRVWAEKGGTWHLTTSTADGAFCMARGVRSGYPSDADKQLWRPWFKDNPIPWSEFFSVTHPPIPEGWEKAGEWSSPLTLKDGADAVLLEDGNIAHSLGRATQGSWSQSNKYAGWGVCLRRARPAIPEGWEAVGEWHDTHAPCSEVYDGTLLLDGRIVMKGERFRGSDERTMGLHVRRAPPPADWADVPKGVTLMPSNYLSLAVFLNGAHLGSIRKSDEDPRWYTPGHPDDDSHVYHPSQPAAIVALTGWREKA